MAWVIATGMLAFIVIISMAVAIEEDGDGIGLGLFFTVFISLIIYSISITDVYYKQGQVDANRGVMKYRLVKYTDGTAEWVYVYGKKQ